MTPRGPSCSQGGTGSSAGRYTWSLRRRREEQERISQALGRAQAGEDLELAQQVRDRGERFARLLAASIRLTRIHDLKTKLPERTLDGKNLWRTWSAANGKSPHKYFFYYQTNHLEAVRDTRWKLVLPHAPERTLRRGIKRRIEPKLFDLKTDAAEKNDLAAENPLVVKRLLAATGGVQLDAVLLAEDALEGIAHIRLVVD